MAPAGDPVEDTAIGILHLQEPIKLPLHLVEEVGDAVAALRDVGVVTEDQRVELIGPEQVEEGGFQVRHILVEVSRVEPAAEQVAWAAQRLAALNVLGRAILIVPEVTAAVMPAPAVLG